MSLVNVTCALPPLCLRTGEGSKIYAFLSTGQCTYTHICDGIEEAGQSTFTAACAEGRDIPATSGEGTG